MGLGTAKRIYVGRELEKSSHNKEREGLVSGTPSLLFSSLLLKVFCFFMPTTVPQSLVGAEHWLHSLWRFPMFPQLTPYSLLSYPPKCACSDLSGINTQFYVPINLLFLCHPLCPFFGFICANIMHACCL